MANPKDAQFSEVNHSLLIAIQRDQATYAEAQNKFSENQARENIHLHSRIDATNREVATAIADTKKELVEAISATNVEMGRGISGIKDTIADRSRLSAPLLFGSAAIIISTLTAFGGFGLFFINLKTEPLQAGLVVAETQRLSMNEKLTELRIKASSDLATAAEAKRWTEKLQDEVRVKVFEIPK